MWGVTSKVLLWSSTLVHGNEGNIELPANACLTSHYRLLFEAFACLTNLT